jgi:hypothetical protein
VVLGQAELLERRTGCDLNLCSYDIDSGNFFGDGVLDLTVVKVRIGLGRKDGRDLHSGVDLDEVVFPVN